MNQKGEITLTGIILLLTFASLFSLCVLKLHISFSKLEERTELFLCTKTAKEELNLFLIFISKTNWVIQNAKRAKIISVLLPVTYSLYPTVNKFISFIKQIQELKKTIYLKKLIQLKAQGCPVSLKSLKTPFRLIGTQFARDQSGLIILKEREWSYDFQTKNYALKVQVFSVRINTLSPAFRYIVQESRVKLPSI